MIHENTVVVDFIIPDYKKDLKPSIFASDDVYEYKNRKRSSRKRKPSPEPIQEEPVVIEKK